MDSTTIDTPYSDEWWFKRLFDAFHKRERRRDEATHSRVEWAEYLWKWYIGDPPLPGSAEGWKKQITREVLRMGRTNLAMLAVESKLDRIQLESFRTLTVDDDADEDDPLGVEGTARRLMNKYGSVFDDASLYASVMNDGYIWVGAPGKDGLATVTAEDPRGCVTIDDPIDPTVTIAALKLYRNDLERMDYAHVVLPSRDDYVDPESGETINLGTRIRVARRQSRTAGVAPSFNPGAWEWVDEDSKEYPAGAQGRGTLVHHVQPPNGVGDIEPHLDILERINNMIVDRLWISKFQVFRQRAMQDENTDPDAEDPFPEEDDQGEKIDWDKELAADPGAMWRLPAGVKIWESTPTDIQGALLAVRDDIKEYAAVTRTPMYVFTPDAVTGSAAGATLASDGAVAKAEKWHKRQRRVFIAVCADMLAVSGHVAAADGELSLIWGPVKRESLTERTAAAVQAQTAGVPWQGRMEDYLHTNPETIQRYKKYRAADLLFQEPAPPPTRQPDVITPPPVETTVADGSVAA